MPTTQYRSNSNPPLLISGSNGGYSAHSLVFGNSNGISFYTSNSSIVASGGGGAAGVDIAIAGNTTGTTSLISTGTASFAGGNNVTLSQNGNNITISAANQSGLPVFAGTTSNTVLGLSFSNSNNVSFGLNAGVITASAAAQTAQPVAVSGSNGSFTFSTLSMGNSNGLLFYTTNGSVVGSYTVPTQSVQTQASGNIAGAGFTTTSTNGTVILGTHNSAGLKLAVPPYLTTQSVQTQASGNIAGTGTTFAGTNISASMTLNSNGLNLALSGNTGGGGGGGIGLQVSNTTYTSGTILFNNANGISFGSSGANGVSASYTVPTQSTQPVAISGSNGSFTFSTLTMGNLNGLTHYTSNGSLVGSYTVPSVPALSLGVSTGGNTAGNTGTYSGQAVFVGGNNITLSVGTAAGGAQTITISGANAGGAQTGISGFQVSNTTYTSGTVTFQNANGISFGSSGANGVSASYTVPSTAGLISALRVSAGAGTSNNLTGITFANGNGLTFGLSTGASVGTMTASYNSTQFAGLGTTFAGTNISGSITLNSNGLNLALSGPTETGVAISAAGSSQTAGNIVFSNSNGVSFGMNGSTITASVAAAGGAQTGISGFQVSNTTYTSGTVSLVNANGISFGSSGANGVSASYTVPSVPALSLGVSTGGNTLGNTGIYSGQAVFVGGNNITLSVGTAAGGAQTITIVGASGGVGVNGVALNDGVNTISTGTALLSGVNMTFSINGQTLSGSVPAVSTIIGANGISISTTGSTLSIINNPLSTYVPFTPASTSSQTIVAGLANSTASVFVYPFTVANNGIAFDVVNVGINYSNSASAATSLNWTGSLLFGLYSSNGSILSLMSSNSYSVGITSSGASGTLNYPSLTGTNGYTYGTTTASTTAQANNLWGGQRVVGLQFGNSMSLSVGQYWLGLLSMNSSSNHAGGQTAALMGNVWASIGGGPVGIGQSAVFTTAFSNQQPFAPMGAYTVTQSTLPSSIGFSNIANTVSIMPFMSFLST